MACLEQARHSKTKHSHRNSRPFSGYLLMRISQRTLDRLLTWTVLGLIRSLRILPYRTRVAFMGKVASRFIGPLAGYRKRVFDNLALVAPDTSQKDAREIFRASADNLG